MKLCNRKYYKIIRKISKTKIKKYEKKRKETSEKRKKKELG